jgi:hypothetical protein
VSFGKGVDEVMLRPPREMSDGIEGGLSELDDVSLAETEDCIKKWRESIERRCQEIVRRSTSSKTNRFAVPTGDIAL